MAAITDYTDVVSLAELKTYLRFDDDNANIDTELTTLVDSAFELIEQWTNWRFKPQEISYYFDHHNCQIRVYDAPIIGQVAPVIPDDDLKILNKKLYRVYTYTGAENIEDVELILNVGFDNTEDVKQIFRLAAMETVRVWFYNTEDNYGKGVLPNTVIEMLGQYKRFIV